MSTVSAASIGERVPLRVILAAVLISGVVGIGATAAPVAAGAAAAGLIGAGVLLRSPAALFGASLLLLSYGPENLGVGGPLSHPEVQKGGVYLCVLPLMYTRGVDFRRLLPLPAYAVLATLAVLHDDLAPGLTVGQMGSTFVALTAGWATLSVRWRGERDVWLLKVVAALPLLTVLFGAGLDVAGFHSLMQPPSGNDPVSRLRGATIPAELALTSFIACGTTAILWRAVRWRLAPAMLLVNVVILALTAARGAAIAVGIALTGPILRTVFVSLRTNVRVGVLQLAALAATTAIVLATVVPRLESRNSGGRYYVGHGTITDTSSGRDEAWKQFYAIAKESPLYGHGLGSGPITKIDVEGFMAQHNEYLRLFLEGGYVGGGIVLFTIVLAIAFAIAAAPRRLRLDLAFLSVGFGVLSITDNTLTSINLLVPFCLTLGVVASLPGSRSRPVTA